MKRGFFGLIIDLIHGTSVREGVLEKIDLTFGGAGNQVMTIDGYEYATWIDYKKWPKIGEKIKFEVYTSYDGRGNQLRCAELLKDEPENNGLRSSTSV